MRRCSQDLFTFLRVTPTNNLYDRSYILRYIVLLSLAILNSGLGMNLYKRRCLFSDNANNVDAATSRQNNSNHHSLYDRDLVTHNATNISCKQRYIVPVVWHVIIDSNKNGDVSDTVLQKQVDILNGNLI